MTGLLIGRDAERSLLRTWLEDPDVSAVLVRGPAGCGKTALVRSVLDDANLTGAITGSGKFAEGTGEGAFEPIMQALSGVVAAALEQLYDPQAGVEALERAMTGRLGLLVGAGLRVAGVVSSPAAAALTGRADAAARVAVAADQLLHWLRGFGQPVILFIDDWRRSSPEVRKVVLDLVNGAPACELTIVLAERDDRPPDPDLTGLKMRRLDLTGLSPESAARVFGRSVGGDEAGAAALAWLGDQAPSLPFDLLEVARAFAERGAVVRRDESWTVDAGLAGGIDRPETSRLLESRLAQLPAAARRLAVGAALWGDAAPLDALAYASGLESQAFRQARNLLTEAGLVQLDGDRLRFAHDRLRAAVRNGLEAELGRDTAGAMAARLAEMATPAGAPLHTASLRLRIAAGLETADPSRWRDDFAQGAQAARARADPVAADAFAEAAWTLHGREPARGEALELIAREAVLAAVDRRDRAVVDERLRLMRENAASPASRGRAIRLALISYKLLGDVDAGWEVARAGLASLGLNDPWTPTPAVFLKAVAQYRLSRVVPLPRARPNDVEPLTQIGEAAGHLIYERSPATAALIAVRIAARIGPRPESFFTAIDAFVHAAIGDRRRAAALGIAAVASMDAGGDGDAGSLYRALYFGAAWTRRIAPLRDRSDEIRDRALAEGDVVNAARTVRNHAGLGFRCVPSLPLLDVELEADARQLLLLGDEEAQRAVSHLRELVALLRHPRGRELARARMAAFQTSPPSDWLPEIEVASVWGDWAAAARIAELGRGEKGFHDVYPGAVAWRFHEQLANMKCGRLPSAGDLRRVREAAILNPADQAHRWLALRAERLRLRGREEASVAAYAGALEAAESSDFRLEAGVIALCARDAARAAGISDQADRFAERALTIWRSWGAVALIEQADAAPASEALEAARDLAATADRASRAKSRLLADVAHELRTPLQGMQGLLDLAGEDGRNLDVQALSGVLASLKTVVDDLSEYGALSSGGAALALGPLDLEELARSEAALAGSLPLRRCTGFEIKVEPNVPALIEADGARLRQVLRNLLSNAVKYGGGVVRVRISAEMPDAGAQIDFCVTVEDEGEGIPEKDLLRLFEPFERGESGGGDPGGLGLGLAVSRQVAQRLGGDLTAYNRPEGGAGFRFRFSARPSEAAPERGSTAPPLRILVADDVPLIRRVLTAILRADGHQVTEAEDGLQAADRLASDTFDLALVDFAMPGLTGLEVLHTLCERTPERAAPVTVLLTASSRESVDADARDAGAALVLRKPVSAADLRRTVAQLFADHAPRSSRDGDATLALFRAEAAAELEAQIARLLDPAGDGPSAAEAHRTAGLAAQFGWPEIAGACERLEADLLAGADSALGLARLRELWTAPPERGSTAAAERVPA